MTENHFRSHVSPFQIRNYYYLYVLHNPLQPAATRIVSRSVKTSVYFCIYHGYFHAYFNNVMNMCVKIEYMLVRMV